MVHIDIELSIMPHAPTDVDVGRAPRARAAPAAVPPVTGAGFLAYAEHLPVF